MPFLGRNTFALDYDGDGLLDVLVREDAYIKGQYGYNSRLMRNLGDLVFTDVTKAAGIPTAYRKGIYGFGGLVEAAIRQGDLTNTACSPSK